MEELTMNRKRIGSLFNPPLGKMVCKKAGEDFEKAPENRKYDPKVHEQTLRKMRESKFAREFQG